MRRSIRWLAAAALATGAHLASAHAQDMTTATVNGTTIWVGGGVQFLWLPDIETEKSGHRQTNSESDWLDLVERLEAASKQG